MNKNILLIEDNLEMNKQIQNYLENFKYRVKSFINPLEAIEFMKDNYKSIDLIVLDLMLPQIDGFDVCKLFKQSYNKPIIISSARADIGNKIFAYEIGADDYLAKPYEPRELVLKIEAILKRYYKEDDILEVLDITINLDAHTTYIDNYEIEFTKIEYDIFLFLVKNRNKIISREQIINASNLDINTKNRTIDMHISNIRQKIGDDAKSPTYIKSIWGIGYKFIG